MGRGMYKRKLQDQAIIPEYILEEEEYEEKEIIPLPLYKVRIEHPCVRMRETPSLNGKVLGLIVDKGIYGIYEEKDGWGRLENGCWTMLQYTSKIENS